MATLEEVLRIQSRQGILQAPKSTIITVWNDQQKPVKASTTNQTLNISLQNNSSSSNVWAYVTGLDINRDNAVFLLQNDGTTGYYPTSPSATQSPLLQNCHIRLGPPGTTKTVTIPRIAGGRIWFSIDSQLTFLLNPGPAVVEPSVMNPTDPNYNLRWSFAEFTFNEMQLFANISYVDFVSLPISMSLRNESGTHTQTVPGIPASGLDKICSDLIAQSARDGAGWDKLIIRSPTTGRNLRALSPNSGIVMNNTLFRGYFQPYVDAVWSRYNPNTADPLRVDTQNQSWGILSGRVNPSTGRLTFNNNPALSFPKPSAADIFSCSTGAFAGYPQPNTEVMGNMTARLSAAFNRSTLLINSLQPTAERIATYYTSHAITNHYSRIVHAANPDGRGYAFPYDDVAATNNEVDNVAGTVNDGRPGVFVVGIGGNRVASFDFVDAGQSAQVVHRASVFEEEEDGVDAAASENVGASAGSSAIKGLLVWMGRLLWIRKRE